MYAYIGNTIGELHHFHHYDYSKIEFFRCGKMEEKEGDSNE